MGEIMWHRRDHFAWSKIGRTQCARRVRTKDGAHQTRRPTENTNFVLLLGECHAYSKPPSLDPIQVATTTGAVSIQPQRTNNILEQFFRFLKRNGRKRSGDHALAKTLKTMLAQTPLMKNLDNPQYMEIVLNGKASLAERFAEIDIAQVRKAFAEAQNVTQKFAKRMAEVFKIPQLPKRLLETPSKKASTP